jgi:HEPN domain-containing protein
LGIFQKTNFISNLFEEVKKIIPKISKIHKKYKEEIEELEIAYIGARYLPIEYSKEKVKKLLKVVKEIFRFLEKYD